jgi:YhcH/YjgK/YiaL family protein
MIYDSLANAPLYRSLSPRIALGLDYISRFNPATPLGRVAVDGDNVFALVQSYEPTPAAQRPFESHRAHIDIQYVLSGEEIIGFSPLGLLSVTTPYSAEKDFALYTGPDDRPLFMGPGDFTILFPQDGHKPGCLWRSPGSVRKIVVKIRI